MPDLIQESTAAPAAPPVPPRTPPIPPEEPYQPPAPLSWEERAVFRETFLYYFTQPEAASVLRQVGTLLYDMTLGVYGDWPDWPESSTRAELRAAVADLFHMQGFLSSVWKEGEVSSVPPEDAPLCTQALNWSRVAARLAREIEEALGPIPGRK
jgi:hypothetical protein